MCNLHILLVTYYTLTCMHPKNFNDKENKLCKMWSYLRINAEGVKILWVSINFSTLSWLWSTREKDREMVYMWWWGDGWVGGGVGGWAGGGWRGKRRYLECMHFLASSPRHSWFFNVASTCWDEVTHFYSDFISSHLWLVKTLPSITL